MTTTLQQFIEARGLRAGHVADVAGMDRHRFWRIRSGRLIPTIDDCQRIVAALRDCTGKDLTVDDLWPAPVPQEAA